MSVLEIGSLELKLIKTNNYSRTAVYDPSGVDLLHVLHRLDCNCVLNPYATSFREGNPPVLSLGEFPGDTDAAIRSYLLTPRRPIRFEGGYSTSLISPPINANGQQSYCDAIGGPFVKVFGIRRIDGAKTFLCRIAIETALIECLPGSKPGALVSNRYQQAHSIGPDHRTIITTSGQAFFNLEFLENAGQMADLFRSECLPSVAKGFQRRQVQVVATPNRAALTWQTVDEEKFYDLGETDPRKGGSGILDVDATYTIASIPTEAGVVNTGFAIESCEVHVRGSKLASRWTMTQKAVELVQARLPLFEDGVLLNQVAISQNLTGRDIRLMVACKVPVQNAAAIGILDTRRLRLDEVFPDQAGVNPSLENDSGTRGTYDGLAITAALQEVCQAVPNPPDAPPHAGSLAGDAAGIGDTVVSVTTADDLPLLPPAVDPASSSAVYTDYHVTTNYKKDMGVLMCAVAGGPIGSEFLKVANETSVREVHWAAERVGQRPRIPDPVVVNSNLTLLKSYLSPVAPMLSPDGSQLIYHVEGVYTYGAARAEGAGDELSGGALPWMIATYYENKIHLEDYSPGIIDSEGPALGAPGLNT